MMVQGELGNQSAKKIHKMLLDNPDFGDHLLSLIESPPPPPVEKMTKLNSVSLLIHHDLSKHDYITVKQKSSKCNATFYTATITLLLKKSIADHPRNYIP